MIGEYSFSLSKIPDGVVIGRYTAIGENVCFITNQEHPSVLHRQFVSNYNFNEKFGITNYPPCGTKGITEIGCDVWIGNNVTILDGVTIGDGAIIGVGAVVSKDVPPFAVVVGNPGYVAKYRFPKDFIAKLLEIRWWNWGRDKVTAEIKDFKDVKSFIEKYA